jgi:hypothetical protein
LWDTVTTYPNKKIYLYQHFNVPERISSRNALTKFYNNTKLCVSRIRGVNSLLATIANRVSHIISQENSNKTFVDIHCGINTKSIKLDLRGLFNINQNIDHLHLPRTRRTNTTSKPLFTNHHSNPFKPHTPLFFLNQGVGSNNYSDSIVLSSTPISIVPSGIQYSDSNYQAQYW